MMPASMPGDTAQPAYQRAGQGLAAGALGVGSLPTATPAINPSEVDVEQAGLPQSFKGGAGVPDEELQGKTLSHLVTHVTVLSYIALVLILVGGATDNWWRVRRTGEGPQVDKRGFWHTCASDGSCKSENPSDERPYVTAAKALYIVAVLLVFSGAATLSHAARQAKKAKAHTELSKLGGLFLVLGTASAVSAYSAFTAVSRQELHRGGDDLVFDWSAGTFTSGWALLLGYVLPLLYVSTSYMND